MTIPSSKLLTLLPWNILTVLSGHIVTLLPGNNRGYWLLNLMALSYWNRTAYRFVDSGTLLMILIVSIWNLDSATFLSRFIPALLLRNLLAVSLRFVPALFPWFIPTLLSRLIPALLLTINIAAFLLSNSLTFSLCNSGAFSDCSGGAGLFIGSTALALSSLATLLLIS